MKLLSMEELRAKVKEHYEIYDTNYERLAKRMDTSDRTLRKFLQTESPIGLDTYIKMYNYLLKLEEEAIEQLIEIKEEIVEKKIEQNVKEELELDLEEEEVEDLEEGEIRVYYNPIRRTIRTNAKFSFSTIMRINADGIKLSYM